MQRNKASDYPQELLNLFDLYAHGENLPLLAAAVRARFDGQPPQAVFQEGDDRVEVWDYDHFDAWETLDWPEVRVLRTNATAP